MENRYKINFDLKNNTATDIKFKQGDNNSAVLEVTLYDGGASVDITDETIEFRFKKADENVVFQDMTHGVSIVGGAAQ
ncbi:MAG TPA: BppU family phage baseplate upper protein, partial [Clostridiaceae bacterium]